MDITKTGTWEKKKGGLLHFLQVHYKKSTEKNNQLL